MAYNAAHEQNRVRRLGRPTGPARMSWAGYLQRHVDERFHTQRALARHIGIEQARVSDWINTGTMPHPYRMILVVRRLDDKWASVYPEIFQDLDERVVSDSEHLQHTSYLSRNERHMLELVAAEVQRTTSKTSRKRDTKSG